MSKFRVLIQALNEALEKIPEKIGSLPSEEELIKKGFDPKTFYHGSPKKNIMEFVPQASDRSVFGGYREARKGVPTTFFSESQPYVENFAKKGGEKYFDEGFGTYRNRPHSQSRIYPVKLKLDNIYNYKNPEHREMLEKELGTGGEMGRNLMIGDPFELQQPEISKAIKELGFNGYLTNETSRFGQRTVGLFYPEKGNVRSVFARFDPDKVESGNIYASIVPPVATAVGALSGLEDST